MNNYQIPPLLPLTVHGPRPVCRQAIQFSADAELAVACRDSVLVLPPAFPRYAAGGIAGERSQTGPPLGEEASAGRDADGGRHGDFGGNPVQDDSVVTAAISSSIPQQFSHHALHFAVSYPPADPRINRHLFRTAQREYERGERGPASAVEDSGEQRQVPPRPAPWPNFSGASFGEAHLPPSVNWTVGGDESTVGAVTAAEEEDEEGRGGEDEAYPDSVGPDIGGGSRPRLRTTGATGHGAVSRRGGSPNLVAALAWSAPGLGRGGRCVLGVLGGMGALVVYGDGGDSTFPVGEHGIGEGGIGEDSAENRDDEDDDGDDDGRDDEGEYARPANRRDAAGSARHRRGGGAATRDLAASWRMIFGVGAHLPLPWPVGSSRRATWDAGVREHIVGFAWSREVVRNVPGVGGTGGGRALLAYATDADEVVLLAVASRFATDDDAAEWSVSELARFGAAGPHPRLLQTDPGYTPNGTAHPLAFSPWVKGAEDGSQQCILSYIAPNYVGFRRITVSHDWHFATGPALKLDSEDCDGFCTFLSTEAFVTWDDDILIRGSEMLCRAVLATPLTMKPYEVSMTKSKAQTRPHATSNCNTTYPRPEDAKYNNPICGVILHGAPAAAATSDAGPDSPMATTMPLYYTLVRMSATATSPLSWWETNLPDAPRPRWAETIQNRIDVSVPADFPDPRLLVDEDAEKTAGRVRWNDDGDDVDADSDDEDADSEVDDYDAYGSVDDEDDMEGDSSAQHGEPASPTDERLVSLGDDEPPSLALAPTQLDRDVHPYRAVIWGLAAVPGMKTAAAGASAVLVTRHLGHWPEREPSWKTSTSKVLFTSVPMVSEGADVEQPRRRVVGGGPSTEARVWAWMYGGGLPVPGVAAYGDGGGVIGSLSTQVEDDVNADDMATAATLLASVAASQRAAGCVFCASPLEPVSDRRKARCARLGHTFDVCAATDLVITSPGTSRACAVCGARCLGVEHVIAVARQHRVQQQQEGPQTSGGDAESVRSKGRGKGARRAGGKGKGKARSSVANNEPEAEAGEQALQRLEDLIQLTITGDRCGGCGGRFVD